MKKVKLNFLKGINWTHIWLLNINEFFSLKNLTYVEKIESKDILECFF